MIDNHTPIQPERFGGLYARGTYNDNVPRDHFIDSRNTTSSGSDEVRTRTGFDLSITLPNIRRIRRYQKEGEATRIIILNDQGQLFDASVSLVTPILSIPAMLDFALVVAYNRAYISPNNRVTGLPSEFVYVYDGSGVARKAAGAAPTAGFTVIVSATAGHIEAGTHIFAWAFETASGFVSHPSEGQALVFDGTHKADFSNIPSGPAGTVARRLVASMAIQTFNGDLEGYEMFYVPNGRISDNSTSVLNGIDFYDADLQSTADFSYDQLESIPACLFLGSYGTRLVFGAEAANKSMLRLSNPGEPESVNELAGFIIFDPNETEGIKACVEFRRNLYVTKGNPGKTYATTDNTFDPSTWDAPAIDGSIGADYNGISTFISPHSESTAIAFFSADHSGLFMFDGAYRDLPLTYKIQSIWDRINKANFNKLDIVINTKEKLIYVLVPLDTANTPNTLLVADYSEGLDPKNIIWHWWTFSAISPVSILLDIDNLTKQTHLKVAGYAGNVYIDNDKIYNDNGALYESYLKSSMAYLIDGYVHHCAGVRLRIKGSGQLLLNLFGEDDVLVQTLQTHALSAAPGREFMVPANFTNEKAALKMRCAGINEHFELYNAILFMQAVWATRPA